MYQQTTSRVNKTTSNGVNKKIISIIILVGVLICGVLIGLVISQQSFLENKLYFLNKNILNPKEAEEKVLNYIDENILKDSGLKSSLVEGSAVEEKNGVYEMKLKISDSELTAYLTKDGGLLFPEAISLEVTTTTQQAQEGENASAEVPKSDNPDVKLFVMSYCPYGLQAQKMYLPVYDLLKDKASMGVYFVDYAMHEKKEIDENLTQYCIQKEEKEKYADYLNCFVVNGDSGKCLSQVGIDQGKIASCISATDKEFSVTVLYNDKSTWLSGQYPKFNVNADLNQQYGVQGSPTIVINGQIVDVSPRSPEKFKEIVCQAFNSPPGECSQVLSGDSPSTGIGAGTDNSTSSSGCGQ
jgi:hypothetical protein